MLSLRNPALTILILLALALISWSILVSKHLKVIPTHTEDRPDTLMENVIVTVINKKGDPSLKIETPKMTHYANNDTTDIQTPDITVYRQSPEPWHIHSTYAKATQGLDQIYFWDNVVIHHISDATNPATTMTTTTLTVFPNKQLAQTEDNVTLTQPDTIIHGMGMLANLNDGTVQLLSEARGDYVPHAS